MIETERLLLRKLTLDDLEDYYFLGTQLDVLRFVGNKPFASRDEALRTLVEAPLRDYELYGYGRLACIEKATGRFIGFNGLKYLPDIEEVDIGYRFLSDCWGRGYATESSRAVMEHGSTVLGLERIVGIVDPRNDASIRVLRKLGLVYEKKVRLQGIDGELDLYA